MTRLRTEAPSSADADLGTGIDLNGIYPLAAFMRRMRVGRHFVRSAVGAGLKIRRHGGRAFITGKDFVAFIESGSAEGSTVE